MESTNENKGRLILLSGPSGVGKGPLTKTLFAYMKSVKKDIVKHVLYSDRDKRPDEIDGVTYHFREKGSLRGQASPKLMVFNVHEQEQGIDFDVLREELSGNDIVFLEIFHERISDVIKKAKKALPDISVKSVFLTPLSEEDFENLGCKKNKDYKGFSVEAIIVEAVKAIVVEAVMRTKLTNRNTETPEKVLGRSKSAFQEIDKYSKDKSNYQGEFLVNHYGEDVAFLWEKLQNLVSQPRGLELALEHPELKYIAETFNNFLEIIGCKR
ncbi:MAG: hypothetical protein LBB84_10395 [Tannerellaceae bacterium]|nr:hypothetical protein [Tannerellaceae bacterium]